MGFHLCAVVFSRAHFLDSYFPFEVLFTPISAQTLDRLKSSPPSAETTPQMAVALLYHQRVTYTVG